MSLWKNLLYATAISVAIGGAVVGLSDAIVNATYTKGSTFQEIKAASFMLAENGHAICSGQFIDEDTFLTAGHCIRGQDTHPVYAIVVGNEKVPMTVVADNDHVDVALLEVTGDQTFPFVVVASELLVQTGDTVLNGHYPQVTGEFFFSEGFFNDTRPAPVGLTNQNNTYAVTIDNLPGSSGSGLYEEVSPGQYQLIGTLSGGFGLAFNFFASLEGILEVIDAN